MIRSTADADSDGPPLFKQSELSQHKLYGREGQLNLLKAVYHRISNPCWISTSDPHAPEAVLTLITGPSGTGKTAVALELADYARQQPNPAYFVLGKFDQDPLSSFESYTPIKEAITDYFLQLKTLESPQVLKEIGSELSSRLTADYFLLVNNIPIVAQIMGNKNLANTAHSGVSSSTKTEDTSTVVTQTDNNFIKTMTASVSKLTNGTDPTHHSQAAMNADGDECFRFVIRTILQIICRPNKPLIMFMDDLQWADEESLALLEEILLDRSIQGLMLMGACRGNEVNLGDELAILLRKLEENAVCQIVDVQVTNLDIPEICCIIQDLLPNIPIDSDTCLQLAKFTNEYTQGNAFGTMQMVVLFAKEMEMITATTMLSSKQSTNLLRRLRQGMETKIEEVRTRTKDDTLQALVLLRILELPQNVRDLMQTCACLGKDFARDTIHAVLLDEAQEALQIAQSLDLLRPLPGREVPHYHFQHDKVQEASYKLIPHDSKPWAHVNIGRCLWEAMEKDTIPFDPELLVNQFRRGLLLVTCEQDRVALAQLCLEASWKSGISSSMAASTGYLELGLSLLPVRHWRDYYELSLNLKCAAAEMNYAIGRHEETAAIVKEVEEASMNLRDQARAQAILIYSLGSQSRVSEAIDESLGILKQLGEPMPQKVGLFSLLNEARKTKNQLRQKSDADLLNLDHMSDPTQLAALNILNIVFLYNFSSRPQAAALVAMRMVRRTVQNGLSAMSAVGFAAYGMTLSNGFGDMENGARYGRLALEVYEIFTKVEWYCRVHVLVGGCLLPITMPLRKCTSQMKRAGLAGLAAGDIEFAMLGMVVYTVFSIVAARPLQKLLKEALDFVDRMKLHRQDLMLNWQLPLTQAISILTGDTETDIPAALSGKFFDEEKGLAAARQQKNMTSYTTISYIKLTLSVTMGEWAEAEKVCLLWEKYCDFSALLVPIQDCCRFLMAMTSLVQLHSGTKGNRQRRSRARRYQSTLRKRVQVSKENYEHRVLLLDAEQNFASGRLDIAEQKYRQAIQEAGLNLFWMEQGIAYERLAVCKAVGKPGFSCASLLKQAKGAYENWGATAKVKRLEKVIEGTASSSSNRVPVQ